MDNYIFEVTFKLGTSTEHTASGIAHFHSTTIQTVRLDLQAARWLASTTAIQIAFL